MRGTILSLCNSGVIVIDYYMGNAFILLGIININKTDTTNSYFNV